MKRIILLLSVIVIMTSCSSSLREENESLRARLAEVESEYSEYQQVMQEYDGLAKSELEVRKYQAEQQKAYIEAVEESKAIEESIKAEAKEKKGYDTGITFFQLERMPDEFKGQKVKFYGKVLQVLEDKNEVQIRMSTKMSTSAYDEILDDLYKWLNQKNPIGKTEYWYEDIIYGYYDKNVPAYRVIQDDMITIYGISRGLYTYTSTADKEITLPLIEITRIEQRAY